MARRRCPSGVDVNDFDEAAVMPYVYDLIRLATSARLGPAVTLNRKDIATAILDGYCMGLAEPRPMLVNQAADWLRLFANAGVAALREFRLRLEDYLRASPLEDVVRPLRKSLPKGAEVLRFVARTKGGGSLGRPRFLVVTSWNSGTGVREAKALVPAAWAWAPGKKGRPSRFVELACGVYRSPDATLKIEAGYIFWRIAPYAREIDIKAVKPQGLTPGLLSAMGADLGTIHAAHARSSQIKADLELRDRLRLKRAANAAEKTTRREFAASSPGTVPQARCATHGPATPFSPISM